MQVKIKNTLKDLLQESPANTSIHLPLYHQNIILMDENQQYQIPSQLEYEIFKDKFFKESELQSYLSCLKDVLDIELDVQNLEIFMESSFSRNNSVNYYGLNPYILRGYKDMMSVLNDDKYQKDFIELKNNLAQSMANNIMLTNNKENIVVGNHDILEYVSS